jgi:zinc transport system permease protein
MRIVGLLLISALMIVPNAIAQLICRSFRSTLVAATLVGVLVSVAGVVTSFHADTPSGGTIVLIAIGLFLVVALCVGLRDWGLRHRHRETVEHHPHEHGPGCGHEIVGHGDHVDYLHEGHRHAAHGAHYDEH